MFNFKTIFHRHALRFYDPSKEQLQHALQTTLAATICIILSLIYQWPNASWLILSAIFMLQIGPYTSRIQSIILPLTTGALISVLSLFAAKTIHFTLIKILTISVAGFLMVMIGTAGPQFALASFFIVIFTIIAYGISTPLPYERMQLCMAGSILAVLIGATPLLFKSYRLRQTKINFWYTCQLYWQERISLPSNPVICHSYRLHLLTCLDKLRTLLLAAQLQKYAFIFELSCDALIRKDNLMAHDHGIFQIDIHRVCHYSILLFNRNYEAHNTQLFLQSIAHFKTRVAQHKPINHDEKNDIYNWLIDMEQLAALITDLKINENN